MTKAERIFRATYYECKRHIETWGVERNPDGRLVGYTGLIVKDSDTICTRTINDVQKHIDHMYKNLGMLKKFEVRPELDNIRRLALEMTQVTLDNERKILKIIND